LALNAFSVFKQFWYVVKSLDPTSSFKMFKELFEYVKM